MGWPRKSNAGLHTEKWAQEEMAAYNRFEETHDFQCSVCKEPWPLSFVKLTDRERFTCVRWKRDRKPCRLYYGDNGMAPGSVPAGLRSLSEVEELLMAPMSICRKHGDINETFSICPKRYRAFWTAFRPTWVTCQSCLSGSKVQVSVYKIILHTIV